MAHVLVNQVGNSANFYKKYIEKKSRLRRDFFMIIIFS